jgi:hypothetical protein
VFGHAASAAFLTPARLLRSRAALPLLLCWMKNMVAEEQCQEQGALLAFVVNSKLNRSTEVIVVLE